MSNVQKHKLPTLQELTEEVGTYSEQEKAFAVIMNSDPKKEWVKKHPIAKNEYIPIERIEYLLTRIFGTYQTELIKGPELLGNSVVVGVRVHVKHPITGESIYHDGVGAQPLQLDAKKSRSAIDFEHMKSNAVQLAAPIAKSYAFKDACDHFGKIFGRDLNRKQQIGYNNLMPVPKKTAKDEEFERLSHFINSATTLKELNANNLAGQIADTGREDLKELYRVKLNELKGK